jgi:hypothetical protein
MQNLCTHFFTVAISSEDLSSKHMTQFSLLTHLPFDGSAEVEASEASFCCLTLSIAPEVEAPADDEDESPAK